MPTQDEFVRALRNQRAYAGDHPILGRSPVTAPPVLGPEAAWRALGSPDPLNLARTYHSAHPMEAAQNTLEGIMNMVGPIPAKAAGVAGAAALPALVRYGTQVAEHAPFFSAAEKAIGEAGLQKAPLAQWLATLRNKGIKEEELNWLGLGKAPVGDTPKWAGHVTKDELNDWIKGHGVQLQEIEKGGVPPEKRMIEQWRVNRPDGVSAGTFIDEPSATRYAQQIGGTVEQAPNQDLVGRPQTKFHQYQLPGGTNYRETLLTLPQQPSASVRRLSEISDRLDEITNLPAKQTDPNTPQGRALRDEFNQLFKERSQLRASTPATPQFTGSHWDEPNVLAHVRHNDRTLPPLGGGSDAPRKALFLEEVQSDWHQKGRKQGYNVPGGKGQYVIGEVPPLYKERFGNDPQYADMVGVYNARTGEHITNASNRAEAERYVSEGNLEGHLGTDSEKRVPDAPFKQSWPDLALKRMLAKAAYEGYDALAWTPGEVQAARYDLSKQIDRLMYHPESGTLRAYKGNNQVIDKTGVAPEKLPDYIGKDAADKLINSEQEFKSAEKTYKQLEGEDLKVGGEGMRAFYDKMLVDKANALGKRYGAKVQQEPLQPKFDVLDPEGNIHQSFDSREQALKAMQNLEDGHELREAGEGTKAHVLAITPELREAAKRGFPLFATGGVAAMGAAGQEPQEGTARPRIEITPNPTSDENQRMLDALRGGQPGAL